MNKEIIDKLFVSMKETNKQNDLLKLDKEELILFYKNLMRGMFLDFIKEDYLKSEIDEYIDKSILNLKLAFKDKYSDYEDKFKSFYNDIPSIRKELLLDLKAIYDGDPACSSYVEIVTSYPSFLAISAYRISHNLYNLGLKFPSRIISEYAHTRTGIDINPGCNIGHSFFIDHGTGIVIGETTIIGNNVKIYQGVTLGALSLKEGRLLEGKKRHPTIEDNVTIYAGATILGGDTIIGRNSIIGGNVFITKSLPPNSKVSNKCDID